MMLGRPIPWRLAATVAFLLLPGSRLPGEEPPGGLHPPIEISPAEKGPGGVLVHRVRSEYQSGQTLVKVLLPDGLEEGKRYRVLYVLPVESGDGRHWGDGLGEVAKHDIHNKHQLICVFPTFSHLPWYADHPTDPEIRQESYLLKVVLPLVESRYPALRRPEGRLLLGFSKSGWGAFNLLLRNPGVFGKAAAWDAPLTEDRPLRFDMGPIFGGQENFEKYRILALLESRAPELRKGSRLVLVGYDGFRTAHVETHRQMVAWNIPHVYRDGPRRKHHWQSGWLPEAVGLLVSP